MSCFCSLPIHYVTLVGTGPHYSSKVPCDLFVENFECIIVTIVVLTKPCHFILVVVFYTMGKNMVRRSSIILYFGGISFQVPLPSLGSYSSLQVDFMDSLFFLQLILPMCDPKQSGINGDSQKPFYSEVETFLNLYAVAIGLGESYRHKFKMPSLDELVHIDGIVVHDRVKGGSNGATLHRHWINDADYDALVKQV